MRITKVKCPNCRKNRKQFGTIKVRKNRTVKLPKRAKKNVEILEESRESDTRKE